MLGVLEGVAVLEAVAPGESVGVWEGVGVLVDVPEADGAVKREQMRLTDPGGPLELAAPPTAPAVA